MSSKTVAVIGATGLFGKSISLALLKLGHKVIAVTRSISDKAAIAAELEKAGAHVASYPSDTPVCLGPSSLHSAVQPTPQTQT